MSLPEGTLIAYIDGAARGNPGPASLGVSICSEKGEVIKEIWKFLGTRTNNQAEYLALLEALEVLQEIGAVSTVIYSDSQLIVRQMTGEYEVKDRELQVLYKAAKSASRNFKSFKILHIPREKNKRADQLANLAIDETTAASAHNTRIERRLQSQISELTKGDKITILIPNRSPLKPIAVEFLKLLKRSFKLESQQIEDIKDQIETTMLWPDAPHMEDLQIILQNRNGRLVLSTNLLRPGS